MNDDEREDWVLNDEGLYDLYKAWCVRTGRKSTRAFAREHRQEIDSCIKPVLDGEKRAHHLRYG